MFPEFKIYNTTIHTYNIMLLVGMIVSFLVYDYQLKKDKFQGDSRYYELIPYLFIIGLLGASVFELLFQGERFTLYHLLQGGKTFYGGVIFCLVFLILYCQWHKLNYLEIVGRLVLPMVIGHSLGRIGCFLGGCCFGKPTSLWFGVSFPKGSTPYQLHGDNTLIPTQLIEATLLVFVFVTLLKIKDRNFHLSVYLLCYGTFRFLIEIIRYDDRGESFISILSPAQFISVILIIAGTVLLFYFKRKKTKFSND